MLGETIGEANGRCTGVRVLSVDAGSPQLEISAQGTGKAMGVPFTDMITYSQVMRPGGVLYGEWEMVWLTDDGEVVTSKGFGVGRPTGPGFAESFAAAGSVQTTSKRLAHLNGVAIIGEFDADEQGNYRWTAVEWKGAGW
jgi:hypothetical protein